MPIISHSNSPKWLQKDVFSINEENAEKQSIRPLRIGFVNYMPDKAFIATEQDFIIPIIEAAGILQFEIIFLKEHSIIRSKETREYIDSHYHEVTKENLEQCDMIIQSGYNEILEDGSALHFANSDVAKEVLKNYRLAKESGVTTHVASCAASQVIAHSIYNISVERIVENNKYKKLIGVYPHNVTKEAENNFITRNLNSECNIVFARNHKIKSEDIINHKQLKPLITSVNKIDNQHETHLFYDPKELFFGFQGHPEYQKFNILKEYLRDLGVYYRDCKNVSFPEIPPNYFTKKGFEQMQNFTKEIKESAKLREKFVLEIKSENTLEVKLEQFDKKNRPKIDETIYDEVIQSWKDTGDKIWARIFNATYQLTGFEAGQKLTTKRGVDKYENPLDALI